MRPEGLAAVLAPAVAGLLLAVGGRRLDRIAAPLALGVAAVVLVVGLLPGPAGLAALLVPDVAAVALAAIGFAAAERQAPAARFHGLMLLFLASVVLVQGAGSLPVLIGGWEVMSATSGALIAFRWADRAAVAGGLTAFVTTRTTDLGLVLAAGAAIAGGGGWSLDGLAGLPAPWRDVAAAGVVVAALGKSAQLPFSFWLSRAMLGPSAVSALLHSAAMVAMGGALLLRLEPLLAATVWAGPLVAWVGVGTAIVLGVVALAQTDLKQVLAASTASQLGFVVLAAGTGGVAGGVALLTAHAAAKAGLFLVAGAWLAAYGTRALAGLRGAGRRQPVLGVLFAVLGGALAGLPPAGIWAAKDLIAAGSGPALAAAALLAAAVSAAYSGRIVRIVWERPAGDERTWWDDAGRGSRRVHAAVVVPIVALAAAAVATGAVTAGPVRAALAAAVGASPGPAPAQPLLLVSALLTIAAFAAALLLEPPPVPGALRWFGLEAAARRLVVAPVRTASAWAAAADDRLAAAVIGTGPAVLRVARLAAALDAAGPARATAAIGGAAVSLGGLARRPQTGRLHQYLTVGVLGAALLTVLLVVVR